jgi:hypothetical protein
MPRGGADALARSPTPQSGLLKLLRNPTLATREPDEGVRRGHCAEQPGGRPRRLSSMTRDRTLVKRLVQGMERSDELDSQNIGLCSRKRFDP